MKLKVYKAFYPLTIAGIEFTVPAGTRMVTADQVGGTINAWLTLSVRCYTSPEYGFWCDEESEPVVIGTVEDFEGFDWTQPLWKDVE